MLTRKDHASVEGSISSSNTLIQKDPLILRRISLTTLSETPLHVSALLGHLEFSKLLLIHNPKLATALDSLKRLPLHLAASAEGHKEVVQALLIANPDECLHRDQQGRILLHYAAMRERLEVVKELMCAKAQSVDLMVLDESGGTTLHLYVQYNHLVCLKSLAVIEEVGENSHLLKSRANSNAGITILRLAIMLKQVETTTYLLSLAIIREEANCMLFNTLEHGPRDFRSLEIQQILMDAGIKRNQNNANDQQVISATPSLPPPSNSTFVGKIAHGLRTWLCVGLMQCTHYNKGDCWLEETLGMLMVVDTMISIMTFQAAINPSSGVWQENKTSSSIGGETYCSEENLCYAGTVMLAYLWTDDMLKFIKYNSISFFFSLCLTIVLISGFPLTNRICIWLLSKAMCITITFAGFTYLKGVYLVMPDAVANHVEERYRPIGIKVWIALIAIAGTFYTIHFLSWLVKVNSVFRDKRPNVSI